MPGVRTRSCPLFRAAWTWGSGVLGLAIKKSERGTEVPASVPLMKFGPTELCWTAGTKTSQLPFEPVYRKGSSSGDGALR